MCLQQIKMITNQYDKPEMFDMTFTCLFYRKPTLGGICTAETNDHPILFYCLVEMSFLLHRRDFQYKVGHAGLGHICGYLLKAMALLFSIASSQFSSIGHFLQDRDTFLRVFAECHGSICMYAVCTRNINTSYVSYGLP